MMDWIEDQTMEAPDGHRWMKPAPEDCPSCPCHTARVCSAKLWAVATPPQNPDGTPYTERCHCEAMDTAQRVLRDAMAAAEEKAGPAPECCGHHHSNSDTCGYVLAGLATGSVRCPCKG